MAPRKCPPDCGCHACRRAARHRDCEAERWLAKRAPGERLPSEIDAGRVGGDRYPTSERLADLAARIQGRFSRFNTSGIAREVIGQLRVFETGLRARAKVLRLASQEQAAELQVLELDLKIIALRSQALTDREIGERLGRPRSWVVQRWAEVRRRLGALRAPVLLRCQYAECRAEITSIAPTGRPRRYCDVRCKRAEERRLRLLRRVRKFETAEATILLAVRRNVGETHRGAR